jgi:hypothetical protein
MTKLIRVSTAVVLIVGAGVIEGSWTERFGTSAAVAALAERFESIPMTIGDWKGTSLKLPATDQVKIGATPCLWRVYTNPTRGISVSVLLLGGLPGKLSTHAPDICYAGRGYTLGSSISFQRSYGPGNTQAVLRTSLATRGGSDPSVLRLIWGWNAAAGWQAPREPRWQFASKKALCKLYIVRETMGTPEGFDGDPCLDLLGVLLPEIDRFVFPAVQQDPARQPGLE